MASDIKAPGRSALWTEAALRALTGTAFLIHEDGRIQEEGGVIGARAAKDIALDAMAIADAFEAACVAAHEAEQEARRERVRAIGRFSNVASTRIFRVKRVTGATAFLDSECGEATNMMAQVCDLLDGGEGWEPAPLDAPAPTTGGEER